MSFFKQPKPISELEEEREHEEAEVSLLRQKVLKKQLEAKGASVDSFRDSGGRPIWSRVSNWLKTH